MRHSMETVSIFPGRAVPGAVDTDLTGIFDDPQQ